MSRGSYSPGDNRKNTSHTGSGPSQGTTHKSTDRTGVIKALRPCYDYSSTHTTDPGPDPSTDIFMIIRQANKTHCFFN